MRAGTLRHRITIQSVTETPRDAAGGVADTWGTYATAWASVEPLRGREFVEAAKVTAEVTHKITLRHRSGVTAKMRVSWDNRTFDILAPMNTNELDRELVLLVKEVT